MRCIAAVDPGTRKCGLVLFETETKAIFVTVLVESARPDYRERISDIAHSVEMLISSHATPDAIYIEQFAMRGQAGEMLHKLIGALIAFLSPTRVDEVRNTTVKRLIAGHGHADKGDVALGVLNYFAINEQSATIIEDLIKQENWDVLDAFAIGIAGEVLREQQNEG